MICSRWLRIECQHARCQRLSRSAATGTACLRRHRLTRMANASNPLQENHDENDAFSCRAVPFRPGVCTGGRDRNGYDRPRHHHNDTGRFHHARCHDHPWRNDDHARRHRRRDRAVSRQSILSWGDTRALLSARHFVAYFRTALRSGSRVVGGGCRVARWCAVDQGRVNEDVVSRTGAELVYRWL